MVLEGERTKMSRRFLAVLVVLALTAPLGPAAAAQREGTFTLSVGTTICDANPYETQGANCGPVDGVLVVVTLESGELVGSCTATTVATPNGGALSGCGVEGVPFNATLIVSEDETTLPPGYMPVNSPQVYQSTDVIPGGGDGPVLDIINIPVETPLTNADTIPTPTPAPSTAPTVGRHAAVYAGSCATLGDVVAPLPTIIAPQGPAVGQPTAIEAAAMATTVAIPLDLLIDQPHAVAVRASEAPDAWVVACGDIGGVDNDDGQLVIGLREVGASGVTGITYLAYNAADGAQTDVSIFLAEGLAARAREMNARVRVSALEEH